MRYSYVKKEKVAKRILSNMDLSTHKISNIQLSGRKVLKGLTEAERDNAGKLYEVQTKYFLDPYTDIWEQSSERVSSIISAGRRYLEYEDDDILKIIKEEDEKLESLEIEKEGLFLLSDILAIYFDLSIDEAKEIIENVDEEEKNINTQFANSLSLSLMMEIKANLQDKDKLHENKNDFKNESNRNSGFKL